MELKGFTTELRSRKDTVRLYVVGDFHAGALGCDHSLLERQMKVALNDEKGYMIGMGDYAECINVKDKRFDAEVIHPAFRKNPNNLVGDLFDYVKGIFQPFAERGRLLALLDGNHELSMAHTYQFSFAQQLAKDLKVKHGGYEVSFIWKFKRLRATQNIRLFAHHGRSRALTKQGKMKALLDLRNLVWNADLYLMAHVHEKLTERKPRLLVEPTRGDPVLKQRKVGFGCTGSFLKTYIEGVDNYAARAAYEPADLGMIFVEIMPFHEDTKEGQTLVNPIIDVRDLVYY